MLKRAGVKHVVLNAKFHEMEAEIVAQAGRLGAVTIATNMAGRGTDILLGGNPEFLARQNLLRDGLKPDDSTWARRYENGLEEAKRDCAAQHDRVIESGGLSILGTERHESRRIDNQLRGRAGRQGDPGDSRFFLSMEDDLMRIFAGDKMRSAMQRLGLEKDVPIESGLVSKSIERAQKQVEQRNFETRKHLLEYDDVNNLQRQQIYSLRRGILEGTEQEDYVQETGRDILDDVVEGALGGETSPDNWDLVKLGNQLREHFGHDPLTEDPGLARLDLDQFGPALWERMEQFYKSKQERVGDEMMRYYERHILMQVIDGAWKDHLLAMDHLKDGIGLRAYGQRDPLIEYKKESFDMFGQMKERIENDAVRFLFTFEPMSDEDRRAEQERRQREQKQIFEAASKSKSGVTARGGVEQVKRKAEKVGRNNPCPCGSGKKYKRCHGA